MHRTGRFALTTAFGLLAVSVLAFLLIGGMPRDPVRLALHAWNLAPTPELEAELRQRWGLDGTLAEQYLRWLGRFAVGDWGVSLRTGEPILAEFARRLPLSLLIGVGAMALAAALAVPLGLAAAQSPGGVADRVSRGLAIVAQAAPVFWLGLVGLWVLGVKFGWISPSRPGAATVILAVCLLAFNMTGPLARVYRHELQLVEAQPFFRTALMKGLSRSQALWRHGHGHALFALLSALRGEAGWAIGGGASLEVLFNLPGLGLFLVQALAASDVFVLQAYVMTIALWLVAANAVLLLALHRVDPRVS